ncbi:MAG: T9SS type A sorting domain-containing protein [Parafilimonas sp.]
MRKAFTLFTLLFVAATLKAQHVDLKQVIPNPYKGISGYSSPDGTCDTLNIYDANNWLAYYYEYRGGGSVLGTNNLKATKEATILETANKFDVTGSDYNFITGGLVYFAAANSDIPANLNKNIVFKIYDNVNGKPGLLLGSATRTLGEVHQDVLDGKLTEFKLTTAIAVPSSKKFYVSVDNSNFSWRFTNHDSIAIVATDNHATVNNAFQYIKFDTATTTKWDPVNQFWRNSEDSLDVTLFVFPYVSNSLDDCSILPVNIFNFGGFVKDNKAYLNWSTASENNNKGFYIERSKDGRNFTSVGFVNGAGNSTQIKNYTYTDLTLKDMNVTTTYYRLKQVDLDGKYSYSNVLSLNLKNLLQWRLYPNPVKDIATVELNLTATTKVNVQVISRDGKVVMNLDKGILTQGTQQVFINTQGLAKGSYIVRIKTDVSTFTTPVIKD